MRQCIFDPLIYSLINPLLIHLFSSFIRTFVALDIQETGLPPPCATSSKQIEQAYNALLRDSQPDTGGCSREGEGRGVLRCLLCGEFCTNSSAAMRTHLNGSGSDANVSPAKCALCALSVVHNRRDMVLCSIKAHLLLHLDIYLMCPQCGFTVSSSYLLHSRVPFIPFL